MSCSNFSCAYKELLSLHILAHLRSYMLGELNQRHDKLQPEQVEAGGLSSWHSKTWRKMFLWPYVHCLHIVVIELSLAFE